MLIVCDNCGGDEFRINDRLVAVCILCGNKIRLCDGDDLKFKEENKNVVESKGEM
jgi:polyferredoxin